MNIGAFNIKLKIFKYLVFELFQLIPFTQMGGNIVANNVDLSIDFCGVKFKNPFLLSSSPVSNSAEMVAKSFDAGWSGVVFKTLNSDRLPITHPSPGCIV